MQRATQNRVRQRTRDRAVYHRRARPNLTGMLEKSPSFPARRRQCREPIIVCRLCRCCVEPSDHRTRITVIVESDTISPGKDRTTMTAESEDERRKRARVWATLGARWRAGGTATIVVGAFALGVIASGGDLGGTSDAVAESSLTGRPEFATLEETWQLIHEQWPEPEKIDDAALIYGAAEGMVAAIGDEGHSGFLDPVSAAETEEEQEAEYVGIGVEVDSRCGVPVVASTMTGSPRSEERRVGEGGR